MTSKRVDRRSIGRILRDEDNGPKNPHEEIMDCIESTNDIVSKILEILEENKGSMYYDLREHIKIFHGGKG